MSVPTLKECLRLWWKRLWCWHLSWHRTLQDRYWRIGLQQWCCDYCGKLKQRDKNDPPINYRIDLTRLP